MKELCCPSDTTLQTLLKNHSEKVITDLKPNKIGESIGNGISASVYLVNYQNHQYAYKAFKKGNAQTSTEIIKELSISLHTANPFIISLHYVNVFNNKIHGFFLEYAHKGTLKMILEDPDLHLLLETKVKFIRQIFSALTHIHNGLGIIHNDLYLENFLVFNLQDPLIKLCDFSESIINGDVTNPGFQAPIHAAIAGTILTKAPEILNIKNFLALRHGQIKTTPEERVFVSPAIDIYAAGVCLYQILMGRYPWQIDKHPPDFYASIHIHAITIDKTPPGDLSLQLPNILHRIHQQCSAYEPQHRPTAAEVLLMLPTDSEMRDHQWRKPKAENITLFNNIHGFFRINLKDKNDISQMRLQEINLFNQILQLSKDAVFLDDFQTKDQKLSPLAEHLHEKLTALFNNLLDMLYYLKNKKEIYCAHHAIEKSLKEIPPYFLKNNVLGIALAQLKLIMELRHGLKVGVINNNQIEKLEESIISQQKKSEYKIKYRWAMKLIVFEASNTFDSDQDVFDCDRFFLKTNDFKLITKSTQDYNEKTLSEWINILLDSTKNLITDCQDNLNKQMTKVAFAHENHNQSQIPAAIEQEELDPFNIGFNDDDDDDNPYQDEYDAPVRLYYSI